MDLSKLTTEAGINPEGTYSPELLAKVEACESMNELVSLLNEEGVDLTDEQLENISGGDDWGGGHKNCKDYCGC